jgi:hypothetical protein
VKRSSSGPSIAHQLSVSVFATAAAGCLTDPGRRPEPSSPPTQVSASSADVMPANGRPPVAPPSESRSCRPIVDPPTFESVRAGGAADTAFHPGALIQRDKAVSSGGDRLAVASYLNAVHTCIHPLFTGSFLVSLQRLPGTDALARTDLIAEVELVVDGASGALESATVSRTSGVPDFDRGALMAARAAFPVQPVPAATVSSDGDVYLSFEFHSNPDEGCSTYFARLIKLEL